MLKIQERSIPTSCWNKAKDDEVVFVLKSTDKAMSTTIRFWIDKRVELGLNESGDDKIQEALITAQLVDRLGD